ncbi:MAG TPA: hypothetical protein VFF06_32800, partial [Polyangia bacterium]|nr:hypothetical protein [Polyangia bacterium]
YTKPKNEKVLLDKLAELEKAGVKRVMSIHYEANLHLGDGSVEPIGAGLGDLPMDVWLGEDVD